MPGFNAAARRKCVKVALVVLGVAACARSGAPTAAPRLDPTAQHAAAGKIARGFAEVCLGAADASAATRALEAQGWPRFGVVWDQPDSVFYAAKPSSASPAGLFVIGDRRWNGTAVAQLTCVGHYGADDAGPMTQAIERRWGPSHEGPSDIPGSRAWAFRMTDGALAAAPVGAGAGGPPTASAIAALRPGEALVYAQVSYNRMLHDVASLVSVRRAESKGAPPT